jgi:hypothetical protein
LGGEGGRGPVPRGDYRNYAATVADGPSRRHSASHAVRVLDNMLIGIIDSFRRHPNRGGYLE